jgi:hypothetical protein
MKKIKHLIKLISIIVLFMAPASCDLVTESIIIENAVNVGSCDINITKHNASMNVTNVTDGNFDVTMANENNTSLGWVRIGAFQTDNPGLNGDIILANVTFNKTADVSDIRSSIKITVNTLRDVTPEGKPILHKVEGCTIVASPPATTPTGSSDDEDSMGGGGGMIHTPTPAPTPLATQAAPSAATTPAEEETPANTTTPTPEKVTAFRTEPLSPPPPILSPIAGIVIVVIAAILGVIRVIGITAQTRDETYAEAITSIKQAECKRVIAAISGIVVVAVIAIMIMGVLLLM